MVSTPHWGGDYVPAYTDRDGKWVVSAGKLFRLIDDRAVEGTKTEETQELAD